MLPKKNKVPLRKLDNFFSTVHSVHGKYISVFALPSNDESRVSLIIPKKTVSSAVLRNQAKRRYYDQVQQLWPTLSCKQTNLLIVIVVRRIKPDISSELVVLVEKICRRFLSS